MKIIKCLLLLTIVSCGSKNNIFYDGKKNNSDIIGNILPAEAAPDISIISPSQSQQIGQNVLVTGNCSQAKTVEFSQVDLAGSPISVNCINEKFEASLQFNVTSNKTVQLKVVAKNIEKSKEIDLELNIDISTPTVATHIDVEKIGINSVDLSWNKAEGSQTLPLKGYILEYKREDQATFTAFSGNPVQNLNAKVTGLDAATIYNFRVKASNGNFSDSSSVTRKTLPDNDFFKGNIKAFNIAGATQSALVAIEAGDFYLNGNLLASLQAGETHNFTSAQMDKVSSDAPFFIAGRRGSGSDNRKGNIVWTTQDWADTNFSFAAPRNSGHQLFVVAYEDLTLTVKRGATTIATLPIAKDAGNTITLPSDGGYQLEATGVFSAYVYSAANNGTQIVDPRPILPNSTDLIGIPSRNGYASSNAAGAQLTGVHSNDTVFNHTFNSNLATTYKINPQGTSDRYKANAVRVKSDFPLQIISTADADGYGSAPFLPRAKMKNTYALNVETQWLALASIEAGTVEVTKPDGSKVQVSLTRSGTSSEAPYQVRMTNLPAGSIIRSTVATAAWYEPKNDNFGSNNDETLLFGYNL